MAVEEAWPTEADELHMMQTPDEWPMLPFLTLKRYVKGQPFPECSHLMMGEGFVIRGKDYGSAQALYDAGWRVD